MSWVKLADEYPPLGKRVSVRLQPAPGCPAPQPRTAAMTAWPLRWDFGGNEIVHPCQLDEWKKEDRRMSDE